ncbi:MHYT domain-containing protein [Marinobacter sp. M1N3S26]|uniref:MHYT domain-containing protein n=1 Tax=Marinobacter sp. M1N3S26 TaxID=3382299 RepID=UPI00387AC72F
MTGHYDYGLVLVSYLVAVLAGYSALYFGAQMTHAVSGRRLWLGLGAFTMGTGVWTMHFVGMQAHKMEMVQSYDLGLTVLSWFAAVIASGLALNRIGLPRISALQIAVSSLFMASGIVVMHYVGMEAMRLSPGLVYNWPWVTVSVVIALAASAGAMILSRQLADAEGARARVLHAVAALIMGAAISGMHYTGMFAVSYPTGAMPHPDNLVTGGWMGVPLAITIGLLLILAIVVIILDRRATRLAAEQAEADRKRVSQMAFRDSETGLPNRSALDQQLLDRIVKSQRDGSTFALLYLNIRNFRELAPVKGARETPEWVPGVARNLSNLVRENARGIWLCRYSESAFAVIVDDPLAAHQRALFRRIQELVTNDRSLGDNLEWDAGQSLFPDSGSSSRSLVRAAMIIRNPGEFGDIPKETTGSDSRTDTEEAVGA